VTLWQQAAAALSDLWPVVALAAFVAGVIVGSYL
jgi:hypothetical protein